MIFGMRGGKPKNPLDSEVLGTFNFTDYGLSYATAAELEAIRVYLHVCIQNWSRSTPIKILQSYNADKEPTNQFLNHF